MLKSCTNTCFRLIISGGLVVVDVLDPLLSVTLAEIEDVDALGKVLGPREGVVSPGESLG